MGWMKDETGLDKCAANYVALTPLSHLARAADVFAHRTAVVYGDHRVTYAQYHARCTKLASALAAMGVQDGDVVATLLPNIPAQAEAHFGVPACGAVLNTINTRLDVDTISYIFEHGGASVVLADTQFIELAEAASARMAKPQAFPPQDVIPSMKTSLPVVTRRLHGACPRTNGRASRSTIPQAPRGGPRVSSITTAARI
jgi:fatty-acyl-CoA synthase